MSYWEAGATLIAALGVPPVIEALKGGLQIGPVFLADGFKFTAIVLAVLGAVGFFIAISRVREKPLAADRLSTFSLGRSILECFRNPSFGPYVAAVFAAKIGIGFVMISLPFLTTAVLHKGEGFTAVLLAPLFLSTIVGFVLAQALVNRIGLKRAFRYATAAASVFVLGFLGVYFLGGRGLPLTGFERLPSDDILLTFAPADTRPAATGEQALAPDQRFARSGGAVFVRLTDLEWRSLFADLDRDHFLERVAESDERALRGLIRTDLSDVEIAADVDAGQWLSQLSNEELVRVLRPEAAEFLFPERKRRYEDELFLGSPSIEAPPDGTAEITLRFTAGLLQPPEATHNWDGWRMLFLSPEEREALGPAVSPKVISEEEIVLAGEVSFTDGNLLFSGFRPVADTPHGPAAAKLFEDPNQLEYLISRFELRREYEWGGRIWLAILLCFLLGFPAAILMSMYRPIVCEIVDLDEQRVGTRREAMYFGVEGLLTKSADGVAAILTPAAMLIGHMLLPPPFGYVLPFAGGALAMAFAFVVFGRYPLGQPQ